jgi:hypothetical protein
MDIIDVIPAKAGIQSLRKLFAGLSWAFQKPSFR